MKAALITGGGSGIGKALALHLAKQGVIVYIVGRDLAKLKQTQASCPNKINVIQADVSNNRQRQQIHKQLRGIKLDYLVHNAGVMNNVCTFDKIKLKQWQEMQKINVEAPMFLTQQLLNNLKPGSRVLHISSGAGHNPYAGMLCYGMSKAALLLLYRGLNVELQESGILFGSFMPGLVDTDIVLALRTPTVADFPRVEFYQNMHQEGKLRNPTQVGFVLAQFLQNTSNEVFISKDWRIEEFEKILL